MQRALYALVGVFVLIVAGGFTLPRFARVEVSTLVDAPPSVVFAQANDFRRLALWAPPEADDPDARLSYSGPPRGEGARVEWSGPVSGGGAQLIVESIPYEYVSYLVNPGETAEAAAWVAIEPVAGGTRVTRGFEHDYAHNLVGRYFGVLWSGMIRRDYGLSLDRLESLLQRLPTVDYAGLEVEETYVEGSDIAYVVMSVPQDSIGDSAEFDAVLDRLGAFLDTAGLERAGAPFAIRRGAVGSRFRLDLAIPYTGTPAAEAPADVVLGRRYEGQVLRATHPGGGGPPGTTHDKLAAYLEATGRRANGAPWERWVSGTDPAEPDLEVFYPVLAD